jgi:hypothetical protein
VGDHPGLAGYARRELEEAMTVLVIVVLYLLLVAVIYGGD